MILYKSNSALASRKGGGFLRIVIGAVIVAAALMTFGGSAVGLSAMWSATSATIGGSIALSIGTSLILGGLLSLVSPTPRRDANASGQADPEASKYLGAQKNTVRIGTRIPIAYGECKVFGHYISFDSQAVDVAV